MFEDVNPRLPLMLAILAGLFVTVVVGDTTDLGLDVTKWVASLGFLMVLVVLSHRYSLQARESLRKYQDDDHEADSSSD